jgi:hypothetical protein
LVKSGLDGKCVLGSKLVYALTYNFVEGCILRMREENELRMREGVMDMIIQKGLLYMFNYEGFIKWD